jgi:hypothetical protein
LWEEHPNVQLNGGKFKKFCTFRAYLVYEVIMGERKTKADQLAGLLGELSVEELDEQLIKIGRAWTRVYTNRQLRAKEEGIETPPPEPPKIEIQAAGIVRQPPIPQNAVKGIVETIADLAHRYQTDEHSPYRQIRHQTRSNYDLLIRRIVEDCGGERLVDWNAEVIQRHYDQWADCGKKITAGRSAITMVRILMNFGMKSLVDKECERVAVILHNMDFAIAKRQDLERLTEEHAIAIIRRAHEMGRHSIAFAQALQFDCKLAQKDVLGEWVPMSVPGEPAVINGKGQKWLYGLRWSEIDKELILRHQPSRGGKPVELQLQQIPRVKTELDRIREQLGELPSDDSPVIVSERSGRPWQGDAFRKFWRKIADEVGVPSYVFNMDSRVGGSSTERASDGHSSESQEDHQEKDRPADADWQSAGRVH